MAINIIPVLASLFTDLWLAKTMFLMYTIEIILHEFIEGKKATVCEEIVGNTAIENFFLLSWYQPCFMLIHRPVSLCILQK